MIISDIPYILAIDSGEYKYRFLFQTTIYYYQKNNTGIEKLYFRFNQDILYIFGFTESNIIHSTIDFLSLWEEVPQSQNTQY